MNRGKRGIVTDTNSGRDRWTRRAVLRHAAVAGVAVTGADSLTQPPFDIDTHLANDDGPLHIGGDLEINDGLYRGTDGATYYLRVLDGRLWWYGEHPGLAFSNVFRGDIADGEVRGTFWEVPKGRTAAERRGHPLILRIEERLGQRVLRSVGGDGFIPIDRFWGVWGPIEKGPARPLAGTLVPAGYQADWSEATDLTGAWVGANRANYYVHQTPEGAVIWFAEHPTVEPNPGGQSFAHVFVGSRSGGRVTGEFVDVPKGTVRGAGSVAWEVVNPWTLRRSDGGNTLWRVEGLEVDVTFDQLEIQEMEDASGDDPNLYLTFAKADGETIILPDGCEDGPTVQNREVRFSSIEGGIGVGHLLPIRLSIPASQGTFRTNVMTFPGIQPRPTRASMGFGAIAWDLDDTAERKRGLTVEHYENQLRLATGPDLGSPLCGPRHTPVDWERTIRERGAAADRFLLGQDSIFTDSDDFLGVAAWGFTYDELVDMLPDTGEPAEVSDSRRGLAVGADFEPVDEARYFIRTRMTVRRRTADVATLPRPSRRAVRAPDVRITPTDEPERTPTEEQEPETSPTEVEESTPTEQQESTPTDQPETTPTDEPQTATATPTEQPETTPTEEQEPETTPTEEPQTETASNQTGNTTETNTTEES